MRPIRVLLVEDQPLVRWGIRNALAARGCTVIEAHDVASMMRLLTNQRSAFDVVLLDDRLPDSQGLMPLKQVRQLAPATRVIMVSADMAPEVAEEAGRLGAQTVLSKPLDLDELCALVTGMAG